MLMRATASLLPLLELRSFCRCCPKTLKMSNAGGAGSGLVLETSNTTCKNRMNRGLFFVYCCISWCSVFPCITSCLHITVGMRVLMGASTEVLPSHTTDFENGYVFTSACQADLGAGTIFSFPLLLQLNSTATPIQMLLYAFVMESRNSIARRLSKTCTSGHNWQAGLIVLSARSRF
uniref:Uncharacterized protein n=1 Tax=Physcomitrium patens TaxID=3218 RepID=A9TF67_PHYPA